MCSSLTRFLFQGEDTPLIHAVKNHKGSNEMLALLLRHGAIVNYCGPRQKQGPLHVAISSYKADVVAFLLENNADMNALDTVVVFIFSSSSHEISLSSVWTHTVALVIEVSFFGQSTIHCSTYCSDVIIS